MKPPYKRLSRYVFLFSGIWIISCFAVAYADPNLAFEYSVINPKLFMAGEDFARKALLDLKLQKYVVQKGDTLFGISRYSFASVESIKSINKIINPHRLVEGQILYLPPLDKEKLALQIYQLKKGDSILAIQEAYHLTNWQFWRLNSDVGPLKIGDSIYLPKIPGREELSFKMQICLVRPLRGLLTSRYGTRWGRMHYGIDLAAPFGTPVKAAGSGHISFAGWMGSYGLLIIINHGKYKTYYGHLSKILVRKGIPVHQGEVIGKVGATGRAYGNHLHFEVEKNGVKVNPYGYIENAY